MAAKKADDANEQKPNGDPQASQPDPKAEETAKLVEFVKSRGYAQEAAEKIVAEHREAVAADFAKTQAETDDQEDISVDRSDHGATFEVLRHLELNGHLHRAGSTIRESMLTAEQIAGLVASKTIRPMEGKKE
jgi:hypothetical protein